MQRSVEMAPTTVIIERRNDLLAAVDEELTLSLRAGALSAYRALPACQTILNAIGDFLADGCQVEEFLFADIFRFFRKLPIYRRLVPEIIIPIHACHFA